MKVDEEMIAKLFGHLKTVFKHKWVVFKLCVKAGIPWQGITHDLSKFSLEELKESIKYYTGTRSPLALAKEKMVIRLLGYIMLEEISIIMNIGMIMGQKWHLR